MQSKKEMVPSPPENFSAAGGESKGSEGGRGGGWRKGDRNKRGLEN